MDEKKHFVTEQKELVSAGMYDLGDGQFASSLAGKQKVRSIIVDVDEHQGIALGVCPSLMMLP